jgi:threonine dehydrogenase-like Zn-dependent dehydrogenase
MKQLVITSPGVSAWTDAPIPIPDQGEALIRVEAVATCPQWDLHIMNGEPMFPGMDLPYPYYPGQPGHEMVGFVEAVANPSSSLEQGDRVAAWRDSGPTCNGAYSQYVSLPTANLLPVSEDLAVEEIASLELAMCVQVSFDQVLQFESLNGKSVGITGLGPAGLIAVQIAKALGASVVAYDPVSARCDLARTLGADEALDPATESRADTFLDFGFDMTGLPTPIRFLVDRTRSAVAMFGVVREDIVFPASKWYGGFCLIGYGSHNLGSAKRALTWIQLGKLRLAPLVTQRLGFEDYDHGVSLLRSKEAIKVLFDPWTNSKG